MGEPVRRIAVTGATGYIGTRLVERLEGEDQVERVLAIDTRPPAKRLGHKVAFHQQDVAAPFHHTFSEHQIEAVVHLAYLLRPSRNKMANQRVNIGGIQNMLEASRVSGVRHIVYLSSTSVYGAHANNPSALTEESPPRPVRGFRYSHDKLQCEYHINQFASNSPDVTVTMLRCCPVLGPSADNFVSQAFLKPFLVAAWGHDPPMQFIHENDLTDALILCTLNEAPGLYNLAGRDLIHWSEMARILGRRLVTLPAPLLSAAVQAAWTLRLQSDSPASGLSFIKYPWVASTEKIMRELDFRPRYTSRQAWEAFARAHQRSGAPRRFLG